MGQHTWFYRSKELRQLEISIYEKIESGGESLNFSEISELEQKIIEIRDSNDTEYHDLFRTCKRNEDGSYTEDVISSKEECFKWLEENKETVTFNNYEESLKLLNEFWEEYPDGFIDFG